MRALTYLQKSPDTGVYRVRRIIPARMRHAFGGRREYLKSLGTREIGRARSLAMPILADLQVQFDRIDGQIIPEGPGEVIQDCVRDDGPMVMDAAQEAVSECPDRVSDVPHDHQMAVSHATGGGKRLSDLRDALIEAKRYRPKTLRDVHRAYELMIELHGDMPVKAVEKSHIRELRDVLSRYPVSNRTEAIRKMDIRRVVKRDWPHTMNPASVAKMMGFVSQGFQLGVSEGWCESNPREGIMVRDSATAVHTERSEFRPHHLEKFFSSPLFTGCRSDRFIGEPGDHIIRDYRYWLPWLALFTGARMGELCQLEVGNLRQDEGIWYLEITDYSDLTGRTAKHLKTKHSKRVVPVHQVLIKLGFLDYAAKIGSEYLFPSRYGTPQKLVHEYSKAFGRYLTRIGLEDRELVFHSFRHNFKTACRFANIPTEVHDELTGHRPMTVGGWYGERQRRIEYLKELVDRIEYEGLLLFWGVSETD